MCVGFLFSRAMDLFGHDAYGNESNNDWQTYIARRMEHDSLLSFTVLYVDRSSLPRSAWQAAVGPDEIAARALRRLAQLETRRKPVAMHRAH